LNRDGSTPIISTIAPAPPAKTFLKLAISPPQIQREVYSVKARLGRLFAVINYSIPAAKMKNSRAALLEPQSINNPAEALI
jgi:hypothetical protein